MNVGVNTYGMGRELRQHYEKTLERLKRAGVTSLEPMVDFEQECKFPKEIKQKMKEMGLRDGYFALEDAGEEIKKLRERGFAVRSIHISDAACDEDGMRPVVDFMTENQILYGVYSFQEPSVKKIQEKIPDIRKVNALFQSRGITFLIHNHDVEWQENEGTNVMETLLCQIPDLKTEMDMGWLQYAGKDAGEIMGKFGSQIRILHIKDLRPGVVADHRENFCVTPGTGILPLKQIMETSKELDLDEEAFIIDQDNSVSGDIIADICEGILHMQKIMGEIEEDSKETC